MWSGDPHHTIFSALPVKFVFFLYSLHLPTTYFPFVRYLSKMEEFEVSSLVGSLDIESGSVTPSVSFNPKKPHAKTAIKTWEHARTAKDGE